MLDYYDAFLIGLTATPDKRTFGFFNENVVSEYTFEESVTDDVNVPYDVFIIETEISKQGAAIAKQAIQKREKLSRKKRWEQLDDDYEYSSKQLDKDVVNPSQIRHVIRAFRDSLPKIFPDRFPSASLPSTALRDRSRGRGEVPKSLIFAKTGGLSVKQLVRNLLDAYDPDIIEQRARAEIEQIPPADLCLPWLLQARYGNGFTTLGAHAGAPLHRVVQWFKTMTTNEYIRGVKTLNWPPFNGRLWQRHYWEHVVRNESDYRHIAEYIQTNPAKWQDDDLYEAATA